MGTILITGSRSIKLKEYIYYILNEEIKEGDYVIQGGAEGVDLIILDWCKNKDKQRKVKDINWKTYLPIKKDKTYYLCRNAEMVAVCERVIAIWDGKSRGTDFTIRYARSRNIPVKVYNPNKNDKEKI